MSFPELWTPGDPPAVLKLNNPTGTKLGSASSLRVGFGGVLFSGNGALGNANAAETDVYSRTLEANGCAVNGDTLEQIAAGSFAANGNTKTIRLKLGGLTFYTYAVAINGGFWQVRARIHRNSTTNYRAFIEMMTRTAAGVSALELSGDTGNTVDWTIANTLVVTLQGTSTSDIIINDYKVIYWPGTSESV